MRAFGNTSRVTEVKAQVNIDIWSDIACPWCFIGKRRFDKALAAFPHRDEVKVTWHSYQLDPTLPDHDDRTEAEYLAAAKGIPVEQVQQMFAGVTAQAVEEGLSYNFDSLVVANSMKGHQLIHLAKEHGATSPAAVEQIEDALFSAHFELGEDIGDIDVLVRIGTDAGLSEQEIRKELATGSRIPAVLADIKQAASLGLNSVPSFVLNMKFAVPGAQPVEVFTQALHQAWDDAHPVLQDLTTLTAEKQKEARGPHRAQNSTEDNACGPDGCAL